MNVTLGIYTILLIFFFVIVPGYVARRFYYNGEFSKQLNHSNNYIRNITYSLFIGISISLFLILLINWLKPNSINLEAILVKVDENFINGNEIRSDKEIEKFSGISSNIYITYIPYLSFIYVMSAAVGYLWHRTVLLFNLDAKLKILQFKNPWHYLLTGRLLKTNKFKNSNNSNLKIKYTYLDILTCDTGGTQTLYSGLYADYSLSSKDITKLNKLYLIDAFRYLKKKKGKTISRPIPGNVLTILGDNILNINFTYIFEKIEDKKERRYLNKRLIKTAFQNFTIFLFLFLFVAIIFNLDLSNHKLYRTILDSNLLVKFIWGYLLNVIFGLFNIFKADNKSKTFRFIGWKQVLLKLILVFAVIGILFLIYLI